MLFNRDPDDTKPLYRQLAESVQEQICQGICADGERLPTEEALLAQTGLSKGTIRRAYEYLERIGYARRVQGSGVYACHPGGKHRRERAELLAAQYLNEVTLLPHIDITAAYLILKHALQEEAVRSRKIRAALVECCPELLSYYSASLRQIPNLTVCPYLLNEILDGSTLIRPDCELILTTQAHSEHLSSLASALRIPLEEMGVSVSEETVAKIAKIPADGTVGILYRSERFMENVQNSLKAFGRHNPAVPFPFDQAPGVQDVCCMIAPPAEEDRLALLPKGFTQGLPVIPFCYQIDQGSLMHLRKKIEALYTARNTVTSKKEAFYEPHP